MAQPSSRIFSIHGKGLKFDKKSDIDPYLKQLVAIDGVEEIHLGGNTFGVDACLALAEVLKNINTLKVADFADIFTGRLISEIPPSLTALCDALKHKISLIEIDLSDNAFGGRSAEPMVSFLTHNRSFQVLKLTNNGLGVAGGTIVANALLESAKLSKAEGKVSNLRAVICGRNRLENGSAPVWAEAFAAHGYLVEVRMPQNGIRMEGVTTLVQALKKNTRLEHLDFQDNTLTEKGSRAIALALPSWPALRTLNLSDCLIGTIGGVALCTALQNGTNPKLEVIKLQYGEIDYRGLNLLARAIADHLPLLTTLELNGNKADPEDDCITNIKDALETHGHGDALDELDDMEEVEEDEEEEEEEEEEAEEEEARAEVEAEKPGSQGAADDELARLMGEVSITS